MAKKQQRANVASPANDAPRGARGWRREWILLFVLSLFSSFFLTYGLYAGEKLLPGDILHSYSLFRDNMHSLNRFGEYAWWDPTAGNGLGFPAYYIGMLGWNCSTPLYMFFCVFAWVLGRLGIIIKSWYAIYTVYYAFAIPLLFNISMFLLARQMFKRRLTIIAVMVLCAFSPGTLFNLTETIWEHTCYGIFFAAAFLYFLREKTRLSLGFWYLTVIVLALSINHLSLYWNAFFAPLFVILCFAVGRAKLGETLRTVYRLAPLKVIIPACLLVVFCITPIGIAFMQGEDILRWYTGTRVYTYLHLHEGNPLQFVTVSTPGVSYAWIWEPDRCYRLYPMTDWEKAGKYAYLGLMALPLVIFGLIAGMKKWRIRLFILLIFAALMATLSGYSPLFSTALVWSTPLRAVNHFSDTIFTNGGAVIMILLAALGFDVLSRLRGKMRWRFLGTWVLTTAFAIGVFFWVYRETAINRQVWGYMMMIIFVNLIIVFWLARAKSIRASRFAMAMLLAVMFVDVSTMAYWQTRNVIWKIAKVVDEPPATQIGVDPQNPIARYGNLILYLRETREISKDPSTIKPLELNPPGGRAQMTGQTYNSLDLKVETQTETRLMWRDCWFEYWTATVNGRRVPIAKAYNAFKEIVVPAGVSDVRFSFSPGAVPYVFFLAHALVFGVAIAVAVGLLRRRRA